MKPFLLAFLFCVQICYAQVVQLPEVFKTTKGVLIQNARVTGTTSDSIKVMHDGGIATLPHTQLPPEVLSVLGITAPPPAEPEIKLPDPFVTLKGSYNKAELTGVDPDGIRIVHELGTVKVPHEHLSAELLELVGPFDAASAKAFRDAEAERNREAFLMTQKAIMDAQTAGSRADAASKEVAEAQKEALLSDPNLISSNIFIEIVSASSTGGKSTDTDWATTWGSYARNQTSKRSMSCSVKSKYQGYQRARLQCIFLTREITGSKDLNFEIVADSKVNLGPGVVKQVVASAEAEQSTENYALIGIRIREGAKYVGWCWRVIDGQGRICAVRSSIASYDKYAWQVPIDPDAP